MVARTVLHSPKQRLDKWPLRIDPLHFAVEPGAVRQLAYLSGMEFVTALGPDRFVFPEGNRQLLDGSPVIDSRTEMHFNPLFHLVVTGFVCKLFQIERPVQFTID